MHVFRRSPAARVARRGRASLVLFAVAVFVVGASASARAQGYEREWEAGGAVELRVKNRLGRVTVVAEEGQTKVSVRAESLGAPVGEKDVRVMSNAGLVTVEVERAGAAQSEGDGMKP